MSGTLAIDLIPLWLATAGAAWAVVRFALRLVRTLEQIRDVLNPADGPSMRTVVNEHGTKLAAHEIRIRLLERAET